MDIYINERNFIFAPTVRRQTVTIHLSAAQAARFVSRVNLDPTPGQLPSISAGGLRLSEPSLPAAVFGVDEVGQPAIIMRRLSDMAAFWSAMGFVCDAVR